MTDIAATVIVKLRCALGAIKGPNEVLHASIKFDLRTILLQTNSSSRWNFWGKTILSCYSDLTGLPILTHNSFILSRGGMLVRSSHPIIQSACSLLGISLTTRPFSSLTHLHSQFTTHDFHILLPSHSPPKQPLYSPLWYQLQYWACRAPQFPFQLSFPHAPHRLR